jgi:hypothetical protein
MIKRLLFLLVSLIFAYGCVNHQIEDYPGYTTSNVSIAFKNVNLIPMTAEKSIHAQTVLVKGSRIIAVGGVNDVTIPENAVIIDGTGKYLMPGLADMHMHTRHDWQSSTWPVSPLSLYLANGVTTIRDFGPQGSPADYGLHWRNAIEKGYLGGPAIFTCGDVLYGPVVDPARAVEIQKAQGFDFVKFYSFLTKEEFDEGMAAARRLHMYSAGHIPFQVGLDGVLSAEMNEIAHIEELVWEWVDFDRNKKLIGRSWLPYVIGKSYQQFQEFQGYDTNQLKTVFEKRVLETVAKLHVSNTPICTTLGLDDVIVQKLHHADAFTQRKENRFLMNGYLETFRQGKEKHQIQFKGGENFAHFKFRGDKLLLLELKKAGIPILLATDAGTGQMGLVPGFSIHDELRILTENGFTPYEAIVTGTVNASKIVQAMTGIDDFGTIEVGKRADLILLKNNPLDTVENIKNPLDVMTSGRWYDQRTLEKMISPGIPIIGEIRHIHTPDTGSKTQIEILVGKAFSGRLPNDIIKIVVTGPNGELPIAKSDFTYLPQLRDFFIKIHGPPDIGTYTFTVYSKDKTGLATDTQSVNLTIPFPVITAGNLKDGDQLPTTMPTLSWEAVNTSIPVYYRVNIVDQDGNRIHSHSVKDQLSYTVPKDVLKPGQTYFWHIRVSDSDQWIQEQNLSLSRQWKFSTRSE